MTSQTIRRAVAGALTAGLLVGLSAPAASADPATPDPAPAAEAAPAPQMTADEAIAMIDKQYDTGAGGGQISTLIHSIMQLRAQGYRPSNANREAIVAALDKRPNQAPLLEALRGTLAYQRKLQSRSNNSVLPGGAQGGINQTILPGQMPLQPGNGMYPGAPGGIGIGIPIG